MLLEVQSEEIMDFFECHQKEYELEGVEITDDDVALARKWLNEGFTLEDACRKVLAGIREVLDMSASSDDEEGLDNNCDDKEAL